MALLEGYLRLARASWAAAAASDGDAASAAAVASATAAEARARLATLLGQIADVAWWRGLAPADAAPLRGELADAALAAAHAGTPTVLELLAALRASALAATTDAALSSPAAVPADAAVAAATPPGEPTGETVVGNVAAAFGDVSRVCAAHERHRRRVALQRAAAVGDAVGERDAPTRAARRATVRRGRARARGLPRGRVARRARAALADAALEAGEWARALDDRCETARLAGTLPGDSTMLDTRALVLELDALGAALVGACARAGAPPASSLAPIGGARASGRAKKAPPPPPPPPLVWGAMWNGGPGRTTLDGDVADFTSNTDHRCAYGKCKLTSGVRSWRVEILRTPCCGYAGVAECNASTGAVLREGDYSSFFDAESCVGFNNFSGDRDVGRDVGAWVQIALDFGEGTITYTTKHGERVARFPNLSGRAFTPAVDSDENGRYKIAWAANDLPGAVDHRANGDAAAAGLRDADDETDDDDDDDGGADAAIDGSCALAAALLDESPLFGSAVVGGARSNDDTTHAMLVALTDAKPPPPGSRAALLLAALGEPGAAGVGSARGVAADSRGTTPKSSAAPPSSEGKGAPSSSLPFAGAARVLMKAHSRLGDAREALQAKAWAARAAAAALMHATGCAREARASPAPPAETLRLLHRGRRDVAPAAALRRAWLAASAVGEWTLRHEWPARDALVAMAACIGELRKLSHEAAAWQRRDANARDARAAAAARASARDAEALHPALFGERVAFITALRECAARATREAERFGDLGGLEYGYAEKVHRAAAAAYRRALHGLRDEPPPDKTVVLARAAAAAAARAELLLARAPLVVAAEDAPPPPPPPPGPPLSSSPPPPPPPPLDSTRQRTARDVFDSRGATRSPKRAPDLAAARRARADRRPERRDARSRVRVAHGRRERARRRARARRRTRSHVARAARAIVRQPRRAVAAEALRGGDHARAAKRSTEAHFARGTGGCGAESARALRDAAGGLVAELCAVVADDGRAQPHAQSSRVAALRALDFDAATTTTRCLKKVACPRRFAWRSSKTSWATPRDRPGFARRRARSSGACRRRGRGVRRRPRFRARARWPSRSSRTTSHSRRTRRSRSPTRRGRPPTR